MKNNVNFKKDKYPPKKDNKLLINWGYYHYVIMGYQKIANFPDSASNQPSKFRTRNWVEINYESRGTYTSNDIKV